MSIITKLKDAASDGPAPAGKLKLLADYDTNTYVVVDADGEVKPLGGAALPDSPAPDSEVDKNYKLACTVPWRDSQDPVLIDWVVEDALGGLPGVGMPAGDFSVSDVGRILQIQPYGDIAYGAFWSDLKLPIFSRVAGRSDTGAWAWELPDVESAMVFLPAEVEGEGERIEWKPMFRPNRESAGVYSGMVGDSASDVALASALNDLASLNDRLENLQRAIYSPFSRAHPIDVGEPLAPGDVVTSRIASGIYKYFKADNSEGHDAVGVCVDFDSGFGEAIIYKGAGVVKGVTITGPEAADCDHLYVSDTVPGTLMVGPPASGRKQYVGRARVGSSGGVLPEFDMNIQPQQAV